MNGRDDQRLDGLVRYFFCGVSVQGKIEREERSGRKEVLTKNVCMVFFSFFFLFVCISDFWSPLLLGLYGII